MTGWNLDPRLGAELAAEAPEAGAFESTAPLEARVAAFYEEHRDAVFRWLQLSGYPPEVAQEITQEAFLRLLTSLRKGGSIAHWRGWVFRVAHNLAINSATASGPSFSLDEPNAAPIPSPGASPEAAAIREQSFSRLRGALDSLSPQQRQCLHLRAEGFQYREIASILEIAPSTVNEFLRRAIARLRKAVS